MRFHTVAGPSRFQLDPIKGSRFLATVDRVRTEAEARARIAAVEAELPDARHHCWAFVLADGLSRSSDAGEPGGSAGRPILAQIEGHELREVCVVVSRWFGGVKLGVGGLIRAYGGCAGKALDRAERTLVVPVVWLRVGHDYPETTAIDAVLGARGLERTDPSYGEAVAFRLAVPFDQVDAVRAELIDRTAGRVALTDA